MQLCMDDSPLQLPLLSCKMIVQGQSIEVTISSQVAGDHVAPKREGAFGTFNFHVKNHEPFTDVITVRYSILGSADDGYP